MANTTIVPSIAALALAGLPLATASPTANQTSMAWTLTQGGLGAPTPLQSWMQAQFQVSGTLGLYGNLQIQGSNDGLNWTTLCGVNDLVLPGYAVPYAGGQGGLKILPLGNGAIVLSSGPTDRFSYLRPVVSGGDVNTNLTVTGQVSTSGAVSPPAAPSAQSSQSTGSLLTLNLSQPLARPLLLNANCFVAQPINPPAIGEKVVIIFQQAGASGGYTVTWASCWRDPPGWSPGALGTRATASFIYDGASYQYIDGSSAFAPAGFAAVPITGAAAFAGAAPILH
jgi:hypothetical protein